MPNKSITSEVPLSENPQSFEVPLFENPQPSSLVPTPLECVIGGDKELKVYSRRNKLQTPQQYQPPEPSTESLENTGNPSIPNV